MERPDALGNGIEHVDGRESFQEASASGLVVFPSDARLHNETRACVASAFNLLVQWDGLKPDENGVIHLSIAQFSL